MERKEILQAIRGELKEIRATARQAELLAREEKQIHDELKIVIHGAANYGGGAALSGEGRYSSDSIVERQAARRARLRQRLADIKQERAACLEKVDEYKAAFSQWCFYDSSAVLQARYIQGLSWREIGTALKIPASRAKALEEKGLLSLASGLHGWYVGFMAREELAGLSHDDLEARYHEAVEQWAKIEQRQGVMDKTIERARAAACCLARSLGIDENELQADFEQVYN